MIYRATRSPCPAMARGWRLGRLQTTATVTDSGHVRVYRFASASSAATPVPTLPLFGLGILVSLLGLFGLRKLRQ